jgi:hypothetical protein
MTEPVSIEILDVVLLSVEDSELLWGFNIDSPRKQLQSETDKIFVYGWVLGKKYPVVVAHSSKNWLLIILARM